MSGRHHLDEQQAELVEHLRAAGGAPVSFDELRAIGIENPALLCYELAALGLPVTRPKSPGEGMPALSVRLDPEREQRPAGEAQRTPTSDDDHAVDEVAPAVRARHRPLEAAAARALGGLGSARVHAERLVLGVRRAVGPLHRSRVIPMLALAVTVLAVIAIVLAHHGGDGTGSVNTLVAPAGARNPPNSARALGRSHSASAAVSPRITAPLGNSGPPTHLSPDAALAFEEQGHQLLSEGSYATAIGHLLAAIRDSGQSLLGCIEPASESCLTFAYALYDLGRALRLQGRDREAVAVLSERLRIDNQRPTVRHELELARRASA
ncbi:MAG TPA: hypothetical protein VGW98_03025 [Solirubrobacteraceae bacterium]|jgi:hypothetical protein|nr:hypothetical protein [Solirubrobacteraceae bacterium]